MIISLWDFETLGDQQDYENLSQKSLFFKKYMLFIKAFTRATWILSLRPLRDGKNIILSSALFNLFRVNAIMAQKWVVVSLTFIIFINL